MSPALEASNTSPLGTFLRGMEEPKSEGSRSMPSRSLSVKVREESGVGEAMENVKFFGFVKEV